MPRPNDLELAKVASAAVSAYPRVSELPYFLSPESSEYEPMLLVLRAAYQLGSDQELDECCHWLTEGKDVFYSRSLRAARRPKPPSLKEQALAQLDLLSQRAYARDLAGFQADTIRRALENLPDD